jgi:hypothetical protein
MLQLVIYHLPGLSGGMDVRRAQRVHEPIHGDSAPDVCFDSLQSHVFVPLLRAAVRITPSAASLTVCPVQCQPYLST